MKHLKACSSFTALMQALVIVMAPLWLGCMNASAETWSDASGTFRIEADFAGVSGANVMLRKSDGKTINVPINKLSPESRAQAKKLYEKSKSNGTATAKSPATSKPQVSSANGAMAATAGSAYKPALRALNFTPPVPPPIAAMPPFPEGLSLKETVDHIREQVLAGHLEVAWFAFPDDYRAIVDSPEFCEAHRPHFKEHGKTIDKKRYEVFDKLVEILITKKTFIMNSPLLAQVPTPMKPLIDQAYEPVVGLVYEVTRTLESSIRLCDQSPTAFISYHLPRIGAHFQALVKLAPPGIVDQFLPQMVVEQPSETAGTITALIQNGETQTLEAVRYNGRWVPRTFAEIWQSDKDKIINDPRWGLGRKNSAQEESSLNAAVEQADALLNPVLAAKNQQEFDFAISQAMMPVMMMMMGN